MSIAEYACVVHFHFEGEALHTTSSGDPQPESEGGHVAISLVMKILELSTGSIIPPSFYFETSDQTEAASIHEALEDAEQFIEDNFRSSGRRFAVVMDTSTLDAVIVECERQDANIPTFFSVAHDVVAAAKSVFSFDSDALEDALSACGIPLLDGPAHETSCSRIALLCKFAVDHGHRFPAALIRKAALKKVHKRAATHTEDIASKAHAPDSKAACNAHTSPRSPSSDTAGGGSAAVMLPISQYCRFRGLPYSATKADIIAFCEDIPLDEANVHIVLGPGGRPSGDAL